MKTINQVSQHTKLLALSLILLLSMQTLAASQLITAQSRISNTLENAIVNVVDLSVSIPSIQVGSNFFQAELVHQGGVSFALASNQATTASENPSATFNTATSILEILRLEIRDVLYTATLQLSAGLLTLTSLTEQGETTENSQTTTSTSEIRVPAEWEEHAATWMQWPNIYEANMRTAFADIINVIQAYEPVHLLTSTPAEKAEAQLFLAQNGVPENNITWHIIPVDNAWMRDNGPIYVSNGVNTTIQNWKFDAWGGNFGPEVSSSNDNLVPNTVAEYLGINSEDYQDYVLEKGNLEFNGAGILVLNWDCQVDRNPGLSKAQHEAILKKALGVTTIIWAYGHEPGEGTTGHIDGTARFIDQDTLAITDYGTNTESALAIAAEQAGLEVVWYPGDPNWLVGNGFVVAAGEGDTSFDNKLKSLLQAWFPERDIHLLNITEIQNSGGGIHCVTNDQPVLSTN